MKVTRELLSTDVARTTLEELWNKKIYHYAFLTLPFFHVTKKSYRKVFYYLKVSTYLVSRIRSLPPKVHIRGNDFRIICISVYRNFKKCATAVDFAVFNVTCELRFMPTIW